MAQEASPSSTRVGEWMEICGEDLRTYTPELLVLLETICCSPIFRSSPKSCEFLRHVVHRSIAGEVDELKERLIGITLLGRDPSYDTSTDSGVRVRANDVRKRLVKFNESHDAAARFAITLPAGSYVPHFLHQEKDADAAGMQVSLPTILEEQRIDAHAGHAPAANTAIVETPNAESPRMESSTIEPAIGFAVEAAADSSPAPHQGRRRLTLFQLAAPTLAAIFLCIISMRWQLSQENSFARFWQQIFEGDQAQLDLGSGHAGGKPGLVAVQQLNEAAPLLDLAGQFHRRLTVMSAPNYAFSRMVLHVGLDATRDSRTSDSRQQGVERFQMVSSAGNRVIVDRRNPGHIESRRAALLTIVNEQQSAIYIDGTDEEAIQSLVARLCDARTFPKSLAGSLEPGTMTQAIFPLEPDASGILHRATLASGAVAVETLP